MAEAPAAGSEADTGAVSRRPHSAASSPRDAALAAAASLYIRALWPFKLFAASLSSRRKERESVRARERAARTLPVGSITAVGVQCRRPHRVAYVVSVRARAAYPCTAIVHRGMRSVRRSGRQGGGQGNRVFRGEGAHRRRCPEGAKHPPVHDRPPRPLPIIAVLLIVNCKAS